MSAKRSRRRCRASASTAPTRGSSSPGRWIGIGSCPRWRRETPRWIAGSGSGRPRAGVRAPRSRVAVAVTGDGAACSSGRLSEGRRTRGWDSAPASSKRARRSLRLERGCLRPPPPRHADRLGGSAAAGPEGGSLMRIRPGRSVALAIMLALVACTSGPEATDAAADHGDPGAAVQDLPPTPMPTELRRDGEILVFVREGTGPDLAAQDPETGEARKVVETDGIVDCPDYPGCTSFVKTAEWSSDGRWVAFEVAFDSLDLMPDGPCGPTAGLWVQSAIGEPRQLTTPCDAPRAGRPGRHPDRGAVVVVAGGRSAGLRAGRR